MLRHIKLQLPGTMQLPILLDNTLHFYKYLKKHVLVADGKFSVTHRCTHTGQSTKTSDI